MKESVALDHWCCIAYLDGINIAHTLTWIIPQVLKTIQETHEMKNSSQWQENKQSILRPDGTSSKTKCGNGRASRRNASRPDLVVDK